MIMRAEVNMRVVCYKCFCHRMCGCSLYDYNLIRVLELRKLVIKVISLQYRVKNRARTLHSKLLLPSSLLVRRLSQL